MRLAESCLASRARGLLLRAGERRGDEFLTGLYAFHEFGVAGEKVVFVHCVSSSSMRSALRARCRWERTVVGASPMISAISVVEYPS